MNVGDGKVLFVYWGRRGSLSMIALEAARALRDRPGLPGAVSYSRDNELAEALTALSPATWPLRTFRRGLGAVAGLFRFRRDRAVLVRRLQTEGYRAVVILMSHVWTPLLARSLTGLPIRYVVVVHDASRHPGDRTALVQDWILRDLRHADVVVALSQAVADQLVADRGVPLAKVRILPHPALPYGKAPARARTTPLRVIFLGRIMAYKGLRLLVEAVELLRQRGIAVELGVYGEGSMDGLEPRLAALGATVVNRWIDHAEIGAILGRYDVLALPYIEASQSGVAAAARGVGLPIVATPVGGLKEQVSDGVDGLLAAAVSAEALADSLSRLATEAGLLDRLGAGSAAAGGYGVGDFIAELHRLALSEDGPA